MRAFLVCAYRFLIPNQLKENMANQSQHTPSHSSSLLGSVLLCTGMSLCAFIIQWSTKEIHLHPNKPSKIYWLQPGGQHVGEQVFRAFLDVNERPRSQASTDIQHIKSTRHEGQKVDHI